MVHSTSVHTYWLKKGNRFWYAYKISEGSNHFIVDADKKLKKLLFDNVKMAKWLTEITKDPYDAKYFPKFSLKFNKAEDAIPFRETATEEVLVVDHKKEETDADEKEESEQDSTMTKKAEKKKPKWSKRSII